MNGMGLNGPMFPANMPQESRQRLMALPKEKLNEVIGKWNSVHQPQVGKPQPSVNVPGGRPNQPTPQATPFNQQGMPNQFMSSAQTGQQQQQPQMMANMTPQQQMMLRQRVAQMPGQQGRPPNMQSGIIPNEQQAINQIDHLVVPESVLTTNAILRQAPPEVKRWGELKQWLAQNPMAQQGNILEMVKNYQRMQYHQIMRSRSTNQQQQLAGGLANGPVMAQPQPAPMVPPGMAPVATMQPQMPANAINMPGGMPIKQEDIQKARAHPSGKWAALSDDEIKQMIMRNAFVQRQRALQQQRQMQLAQMQQLQQPQQVVQPPVQRTPQPQPQQPQNQNQNQKQVGRPQPAQVGAPQVNPQQQPTAPEPMVPNASTGRTGKGNQANRSNQTSSTNSQVPKNNLKRSSSDDIVEVSNPKIQQPARQAPQQLVNQSKPTQPRPLPTAQQVANMPPDQRKAYQQALLRNQQNLLRGNPADMQKCAQVFQEEMPKKELPLIPMPPEVRFATANKLTNAGNKFKKVRQALPKWYAITHDETRLRQFCQSVSSFRPFLFVQFAHAIQYHKIALQFQDQEMEKLKDAFSVKPSDVDQAYVLANNMMADVAKQYPNLSKSGAAINGAMQPVKAPVKAPAKDITPAQAVPLNAANLQQQQQALNQLNQAKTHNRSSSRNAPPAAPTSAHPPPFPVEIPNPLTQEQLRLPRNKKQKQSATSTPVIGQQTPGSTTSQNIKAGSPEIKAQQLTQPKEAEKISYFCPDISCDHHFADGFDDEAALERHKQEEHINPTMKPDQYALGELAVMLGLEPDGTAKKQTNIATQQGAITGSQSTSKDEHIPGAVGVTMDRQASMNGVKASPANSKSSKMTKLDEAKEASQQPKNGKGPESVKQVFKTEEILWADAAVNPQDLVHNFQNSETGAGGAISDMNVYRSITPNDTPESSKDSGISEPISDISEGVDLAIGLDFIDNDFIDNDWQPFGAGDADDLLAFSKISVNPDEDMGGMFDDNNSQYVPWNDFMDQSMFDKGFSFDTSMFSMNTE
jgi:hypothetical protein